MAEENGIVEAQAPTNADPFGLTGADGLTPQPYMEESRDEHDGPAADLTPAPEDKKGSTSTETGTQPAGLSPELVQRGRDLGFTEEQLKGHGENAGKFLDGIEQWIVSRAQPQQQTQQTQQQHPGRDAQGRFVSQQAVQPSQPAQQPVQQAQAPTWDLSGLNPDQYDEGLLKALADGKAYIDQALAQLASQMSEQQQFLAADRLIQQATAGMDRIGGPYEKLLGKSDELTDAEFAARCKVVEQIDVLRSGYQASGMAEPPMKSLVRMAARQVFGDQIINDTKAAEQKRVSEEIAKRRQGQLEQPSARRGREERPNQSPRERAIAAVEARFRDLN